MMKGGGMHKVAGVLLVIGGLNWLLFGIFGAELGHWVLGGMDSLLSRIVYILVGISALMMLGGCKSCKPKKGGGAPSGGSHEGGNM